MKNKKSKILIMTLVTFLLLVGLNSVFVNAIDLSFIRGSGSSDLEVSDLVDPVKPDIFTPAQPKLKFDKPSEGQKFLEPIIYGPHNTITIHVINQENENVDGVLISADQEGDDDGFKLLGCTMNGGILKWNMPKVDSDTKYTLKAESSDYGEPAFVSIEIRNRELSVSAPEIVTEGEEFSVVVTDQDNMGVKDAKVFLNDVEKGKTNSYGRLTVKAPYIEVEEENYIIRVSRPILGYDDASRLITVESNNQQPIEYTVEGYVKDYDFIQMEGVDITVSFDGGAHNVVVFTNEDGYYCVEFTPEEGKEKITVSASHPGYIYQSYKVDLKDVNEYLEKVNFWLWDDDTPTQPNSQQTTSGTNSNSI